MTPDDWNDANRRTLGMQIGNDAPDGERFLLLVNAAPDAQPFRLHEGFPGTGWVCVFDTRAPTGVAPAPPIMLSPGGSISLEPRSLMLFQHAAHPGTSG